MENSKGILTVGFGTPEARELHIIEVLTCNFVDGRAITVCKLEDGSYYLCVKNPAESKRMPTAQIWLTEESFVGVMTAINLFLIGEGGDIKEMLEKSVENGMVNYSASSGLKLDFSKKKSFWNKFLGKIGKQWKKNQK